MTKARTLANFVSAGNPLADGTIEVADINGVTATAAELNILDGATITTAELNHVSGVTSPIQTQLNAKIIAGNNLSDLTDAAASLVNLGLTATAAELNLIDGSVANTVVNSKAVIYGASGEVTANQIDILAQGDLRLQDTTGGEFVALQAPGTVSSSYTLTLPDADGTSGQILQTDGSGALSFATAAAGGGLQSIQVFTASGTYTKSSGITKVRVRGVGGGGGGGGGTTAQIGIGGGGGGGGYFEEFIDVTGTASETVTIGSGGAEGAGGVATNGAAGGTSSFGAFCSGNGGSGGTAQAFGAGGNGGAGGSATGGDININGQQGAFGGSGSSASESGGGGGSSILGHGGGDVRAGGGNSAATGFGSGGSGGGGGGGGGTTAQAGTAGQAGIVIVEEYKA